ncbi:MAG: tetratricopeptide repeat protein [Anaerolineae bacterium]
MEKQVYQDALDIFQRVLSADPTDFVAHIGMSDCYREQGAIDAAIWHLERAFEQVPNNRDVEEELLKLYELREGQQPRQIARTAGGLARLYARGKLYEQAIPELRKAIAQDPSRLDLQALLVDVLWQARERIEAGKVAADLLRSLPNCITAKATLARLWLLAEQPKEARPFLVQLKELDPYLAYRIEHGKAAPSDAFRLTSLDISTVTPSRSQMDDADWLADLGGVEKRAGVTGPLKPDVITDIFTEEDVAPDWLKPSSNPIQSAPPAQRSESQASDDDPDWLRETLMEETPPGMPPEPKASPAAPASPEAPDWLREIMSEDQPSQPVESGGYDTQEMLAAIQAEEDDTDIPDWLAEQTPSQPTEQQSAEQEAIIDQPAETDIPDWLSEDLSDSQSSPPSAQPTIEEDDTMSDDMFDDDVPDWLSEGDLDDADAAMAWLNEIAAKYDPDFQAESSDAAPAEPAPAAAGSDDDLPDWL